jgi:hypothetical protein
MPALPNVPKVIRTAFKWAVENDLVGLSRIFLEYSGVAPTAAQLVTLADVFMTSFGTNIAEWFSESNSIESVEMTDLSSPTSAFGESTAAAIEGTRAGQALPGATCVLINYGLDRRYRGGHPRSYVPALISTDLNTEQTWTSATLGDFLTAWTTFAESAVGSEWSGGGTITNVNVSFFEGFTPVQNPITLRYRNVPKVRVTPLVDIIATMTANPAPCFQTRRGLIP